VAICSSQITSETDNLFKNWINKNSWLKPTEMDVGFQMAGSRSKLRPNKIPRHCEEDRRDDVARLNDAVGQARLNDEVGQARLNDAVGQARLNDEVGQARLNDAVGQAICSSQTTSEKVISTCSYYCDRLSARINPFGRATALRLGNDDFKSMVSAYAID
jgi:hypothetical protein